MRQHQSGQAATEFIIAAVFLLVPLFLIIPLLGKYADIRHAAIQQARYEAWEYTSWYGPKEHVMDGIKDEEYAGRKQFDNTTGDNFNTRIEGLNYFFSNPTSANYGQPGYAFQENPLWQDHRGDSLFPDQTITISSSEIKENGTPDLTGGVINGILDVVNKVIAYCGDIMKKLGVNAKYDAPTMDAYYTSHVNVQVRSIDDILPQYSLSGVKEGKGDKPLKIEAKASVLSNAWNAGSRDSATSQSRGLVVTTILRPASNTISTFIGTLNNIAQWLRFAGVVAKFPGVPNFGYVKDDLLPLEHLNENKKELKDKMGLYYYEE